MMLYVIHGGEMDCSTAKGYDSGIRTHVPMVPTPHSNQLSYLPTPSNAETNRWKYTLLKLHNPMKTIIKTYFGDIQYEATARVCTTVHRLMQALII